MSKFLILISLFAVIDCNSQTHIQTLQKNPKPTLIQNDSVLIRLQKFDDSIAEDTHQKEALKNIEQMSQRSTNYFVQLLKERRAKEKRNAIIRIGIGIFFLLILILGLRRRSKKQHW